ncbi:MAG: Asp-tRNA(Asn)/Glu-tRNA(Gln) amidotransferase subunit GatC [Chthoniobacterales bacterium]|jgi:aspartyl-tRNA(Asn)/glutamyl-tRNA(Gln) amidotransferase subunit C|nr:Asp-tRNA(Asn)/Glu-tRNA(Gln) amidotransferase subunit GatC [Chthoniobacterales bacterium]
MSVPHLDVRYVADLVRLQLTDEEIAELQPQLDHVLSYIAQLNEVDVDGIEPTAHASAVYNVFREDVPRDCFTQEQATANAPHSGSGLFLVPKVVEG